MASSRSQKRKLLKRLLVALILLIAGSTIGVFTFYRQMMKEPEKILEKIPENTNLAMGKVHHTATRDGKTEWSLEAASAEIDEPNKKIVFKDLQVTFYMEADREVKLTAQKGVLQTETNDLAVAGDVVIQDPRFRLDAEQLFYNHKNRKMQSKKPVKISNAASVLTADSMHMDLNNKKAIFEGNIKGSFREDFTI